MRARVDLPKDAPLKHLNGREFEVSCVQHKQIILKAGRFLIPFRFEDVLILDIDNEYQKAYDNYNWSGDYTFGFLTTYCRIHDITPKKPEYNCPA